MAFTETGAGQTLPNGDHFQHRDADLLFRVREALNRWEARGQGATSSITGGGAIRALEQDFSRHLDNRPCLALPSGTLALRVALDAFGVAPGDEVIGAG